MKTLASIFLLMFCALTSMAQDKNESLYNAIQARDKNQVSAWIVQGASVGYIKTVSRINKTSMLIAAVKIGDSEIVKILIDHYADIEWKDGYGRNALMYAAALNKENIVDLLVESGANVLANDGKDYSVLEAVKSSGNEDMIAMIQEKIEAAKEKKKGNN